MIFIAFSINYKVTLQQEGKQGTKVGTPIDITLKSVTNWFNRWEYRLNYAEWTDTGNTLVDPVLDVTCNALHSYSSDEENQAFIQEFSYGGGKPIKNFYRGSIVSVLGTHN